MVEELADGNGAEPTVGFNPRQRPQLVEQLEHWVVQAKLSLIDQLEDGGCREAFGQAGHGEAGIHPDRRAGPQVGPAVAAREDQLAVLGDGEGSP
jgi:hypothetical protein